MFGSNWYKRCSTSFTYTFFIATLSISHCQHYINYTTEPPTVSTIFLILSHYDYPQVLPVNVSNIFSIINNYKHYFFTLSHNEHLIVLSETIMIMQKQGRAHKWCYPMDPLICPSKSRMNNTNLHTAALWGYGM